MPLTDERSTLLEHLHAQRLTLEMTCAGLDAEQLARRSARRGRCRCWGWCGTWPMAVADPAVVEQAWAAWREEVAYAEAFVDAHPDLGLTVDRAGRPLQLREVLVHMVEEYARHCGHADLLRERVDGRTGQ